jgi:hypothetical protein
MASRRRPLKLPGPDEKGPAYEVGYGKPPEDTRFKPGQSGNSHGRPKGAKNRSNRIPALNEERMKTVVLEEAYRMIGVRDGDRLIEIPIIQAMIRSVALNAAKGNPRSQRMFIELLQWVEREDKALYDQYLQAGIEYKVEWERELKRRERLGIDEPDPIPHPDDIVINVNTGAVEFRGPMTRQEKIKWDRALEIKAEDDAYIEELEAKIRKRPKDKKLRAILARQRKFNAMRTEVIGPYAARLARSVSD